MDYQQQILDRTEVGGSYTTQQLTEEIFSCKKGEPTYIEHVGDITKSFQKLYNKSIFTKERVEAKGYCINIWRRIK